MVLDEFGHEVVEMPFAEDDEFRQAFQLDRLNEKRALAIPIRACHRQVFTIRFEAVGDDIPTR
ncbi:MAG: hypothetical protein O2856_13550 [Planctomycetota bacterium]|nr:hypothetical protein [Planctomycetota bacterium]